MSSPLFSAAIQRKIEKQVMALLNERADFLSEMTAESTRAAGERWDCLTIGALGKGQIQIANAKHLEIDASKTRRAWMLEFCDTMLDFYPREIRKIDSRIKQFEEVKTFWLAKPDEH